MAPTRPLVVISQPIPPSALERLQTFADVEMGEDSSRIMARADLLERVRRADGLFHLMHDLVDADMIAAAKNLRVIASMAIIPATVDVGAATARKIAVTTIPPIVTEATADLNWALLMAAAMGNDHGNPGQGNMEAGCCNLERGYSRDHFAPEIAEACKHGITG